MLEELLLFLIEAVWCVAFPAVHTLRSLKDSAHTLNSEVYQQWTYYWILYGVLSVLEGFISWLPAWSYIRILFLAYLAFPKMKGSMVIYGLIEQNLISKVRPLVSSLCAQVKPEH